MGRVWQAGRRSEPHAEQEAEYRGGGDAESGGTPTFTYHPAKQGTSHLRGLHNFMSDLFSIYLLKTLGATVRG